MYLWDILGALRRRWYVVVPGLLITVIAAGLTTRVVPPTYQATGSVLLIVPAITGGGGADANAPINPYLNFGAALGATAEVVSASVNSDETAARLAAGGATASYLVAMPPNSDAPLVSIEATAVNSAAALSTMNAVIHEFRNQLQQIQRESGSPQNLYIRAQAVTTPLKATPLRGSLIRAVAVVGILGLFISFGGAVLLEAISRGRKGSKPSSDDGASDHSEEESTRSRATAAENAAERSSAVDRAGDRTPATVYHASTS